MKLIFGDMFCPKTYRDENGKPIVVRPNALCISVNLFTKKDGSAVMGRGCAKQAADKWPWIASVWGKLSIQNAGVSVLGAVDNENLKNADLIAFPVKPKSEDCEEDKSNVVAHMQRQFYPGDPVPGWACKARLDIIEASIKELVALADLYEYAAVILVRPGVGAGELPWAAVEPLLANLDDRFFVITQNA